jgi:hypothetical protein
MSLEDYPHCTLGEDGFLWTTGQHCPWFLRVIFNALLCHSYNGDVLLYHCHPFQAHSLSVYEVWVEIPFDPMALFRGAIIGNDIDDTIKKMAHMALTAFCERSLAVTIDTLLALFPISNHVEPMWQQCHEVMCDITSP